VPQNATVTVIIRRRFPEQTLRLEQPVQFSGIAGEPPESRGTVSSPELIRLAPRLGGLPPDLNNESTSPEWGG
jgi:hypothetical protein